MLYKFATVNTLADEGDRCGVIQADSMNEAVIHLMSFLMRKRRTGTDYEHGNAEIEQANDQAIVTYQVHNSNNSDDKEIDSYVIRPVGSNVLSWLAEDWNLVFS